MLFSPRTRAVMETWRPFSLHADGCERCRIVRDAISTGQTATRGLILRHVDSVCEPGRPLYEAWLGAAEVVLAEGPIQEARRKLGLSGLWQEDADRRIVALMDVPPDEFRRLMDIEDDAARLAQVEAITRGYYSRLRTSERIVNAERTGKGGPNGRQPKRTEMRCVGCGRIIPRKDGPFHSRACREEYERT